MKGLITSISIVLFLLTTCVFGQESKIDSLKQQLVIAPSELDKGKMLLEISELYFDGQIYLDSSYFYAQRAYDVYRDSDDEFQKGRALFNLGLVETEFKNFDSALKYLLEAKKYVIKQDSAILLSIVYSNIGGLYLEKSDFSMAVENYQKAIDISKQENDTIGIAIDYINLGETLLQRYFTQM